MQLFDKIDSVIEWAGLLVPVASLLAGRVNQHIRDTQANGESVAPWLLQVASVLNVASVNLDKAKQLATLAKSAKAGGASNKQAMLQVVAQVAEGQPHDPASCACPCHKEA